jgi:DNA-binding IclR family transcriptional regulator
MGNLVKSLTSALRVLSTFADKSGSFSAAEIADALGLGRSHASKILNDLREAGFIDQDPKTRMFAVAARSFALGSQYLANSALARVASGPMRRLADQTGQTTTLCTLHGIDVLHLASIEGRHLLDVGWRVGTWVPFHATAVGKVLYAFAPRSLFEEALAKRGLPRLTPKTICKADTLDEQFVKLRRTGFSETSEETMAGLAALAVPVFGSDQEVLGALGLIYPLHTVESRDRRGLTDELHGAAREISGRMGAQLYPFGTVHPR